jgi:hypothetical protein
MDLGEKYGSWGALSWILADGYSITRDRMGGLVVPLNTLITHRRLPQNSSGVVPPSIHISSL